MPVALNYRASHEPRDSNPWAWASCTRRRGQALVEFAIIALVFTFLLAAILSVGQMLYSAQVLQQAADVGAQELSRMPLNPTLTRSDGSLASLNDVLYSTDSAIAANAGVQAVRAQIFDEKWLYVPSASLSSNQSLSQFAASNMPVINRLLMPLMFFDPGLEGGAGAYRYPGTVVSGPNGTTVRVLVSDGNGGFAWHAVVEEIGSAGIAGDSSYTSSFSVASSSTTSGIVQLQINYPYQSAAMIAMTKQSDGTWTYITADQTSIDSPPDGYTLGTQSAGFITGASNGGSYSNLGPYSGDHGLGKYAAWGNGAPEGVLPYRRVISCNGVYRREVFGP